MVSELVVFFVRNWQELLLKKTLFKMAIHPQGQCLHVCDKFHVRNTFVNKYLVKVSPLKKLYLQVNAVV